MLVLSGTGASRWAECLQFARDAAHAGADSVLAPPPHFFSYEQEDLREFYRSIAADAPIPVLVYNLPAFTCGLDPEVAAELIRSLPGIEGTKDSSGELELLSLLTSTPNSGKTRLVGNDSVLAEALEKGLCDGTVSGVAGVLPELTLALYRSAADGDCDALHYWAARQDVLLRQLSLFPAPWGLKFIAEARGLAPAHPALPMSPKRRRQVEEFHFWFQEWWELAGLGGPLVIDNRERVA